jgi:hypothetical protein
VFSSNVQPKRRVMPKQPVWPCECPQRDGSFKRNFGFLLRCSVCGVERDDSLRVKSSAAV